MKDKVVLISGGAGGIGGATARAVAKAGGTPVIGDLDSDAGEALAAETAGRFQRLDVRKEEDWAALLASALDTEGRIDGLVNAAGIEGDFEQGGLSTSLEEWRNVLSINLDGTFLGCRTVMPHLLERGAGSIVNISSIVSMMATPSGLAYGASKAGVEQLTRSMAVIGAADGKRVRCNSVHPGVIRTRMTDSIIGNFAAMQQLSEDEAEAAVVSAIPFGERGIPEDVAELNLYLLSEASRYVTGSAFKVDGGWSVISAG